MVGVLCEMRVHGEREVRGIGLLNTPDAYPHRGGLAVNLAHLIRPEQGRVFAWLRQLGLFWM